MHRGIKRCKLHAEKVKYGAYFCHNFVRFTGRQHSLLSCYAEPCVSYNRVVYPEIRKGSPRARALHESGAGKIRNFQPISRRILETVHDRTKVTITD